MPGSDVGYGRGSSCLKPGLVGINCEILFTDIQVGEMTWHENTEMLMKLIRRRTPILCKVGRHNLTNFCHPI